MYHKFDKYADDQERRHNAEDSAAGPSAKQQKVRERPDGAQPSGTTKFPAAHVALAESLGGSAGRHLSSALVEFDAVFPAGRTASDASAAAAADQPL